MNARARQHYSFSNPPDERKAPSLTTIPALPCFRTTLPYVGRRRRQQNVAQSRGARAGPIHGPWTSRRVLERYPGILRVLRRGGEARNADLRGHTLVNFTSGREDIDWAAMETFFRTVCGHMRAQDYRVFVEKSHRWFHHD